MHKSKDVRKKSSQTEVLKGTLDVSRSGMGYVIVEGMEKDILVRPNDFGKAFHGDTVRVQINTATARGKRIEGKITDVAERKQTEFIGTIQQNKNISFFIADTDKGIPDFFIPPNKLNGAVNGDRVLVKLIKWDKNEKKPEGEVLAVITAENANDLAMKEIIINSGFPLQFSDVVINEANDLTATITRKN